MHTRQAKLKSPVFLPSRRSGAGCPGVLSSANFRQAEQQLTDAYGGVTRTWSLGLEKYPAVVFDDKYVVYLLLTLIRWMPAWRIYNFRCSASLGKWLLVIL